MGQSGTQGGRREQGTDGTHTLQTGQYSPQGKSLLDFLEKIGMKLVQRFKIRENETFQGFGHGVVFADRALKPLGTKGGQLRCMQG